MRRGRGNAGARARCKAGATQVHRECNAGWRSRQKTGVQRAGPTTPKGDELLGPARSTPRAPKASSALAPHLQRSRGAPGEHLQRRGQEAPDAPKAGHGQPETETQRQVPSARLGDTVSGMTLAKQYRRCRGAEARSSRGNFLLRRIWPSIASPRIPPPHRHPVSCDSNPLALGGRDGQRSRAASMARIPGFSLMAGDYPIRDGEAVVGGGSPEQDLQVAEAALASLGF